MFHDVAGHEALTKKIIGCAIRVHDATGPGLLESVYDRCLLIELRASGLNVDAGRRIGFSYREQNVDLVYIPDLIVEDLVIVEVKAVDKLVPVHRSQLITYLKLTRCPIGLLMNFHARTMIAGIRRLARPDLYRRSAARNLP
jgi:GxxExxY protein